MLIILCVSVSVEEGGVFMHVQQSGSRFGCLVCFGKLKYDCGI